MAEFGVCPYCDPGTRPTKLTGGFFGYHFIHGGSLAEVPANANTDVIMVPKIEKAIHSATAKRAAENREYLKRRKAFLQVNPYCLPKLPGCTRIASEIHHKGGKIGKDLIDVKKFLPCCRSCHDFIEANPEEAIKRGFSVLRLTGED